MNHAPPANGLRGLREARGLTKTALAYHIGLTPTAVAHGISVTESTIGAYERGDRQIGVHILRAIADCLGLSLDDTYKAIYESVTTQRPHR